MMKRLSKFLIITLTVTLVLFGDHLDAFAGSVPKDMILIPEGEFKKGSSPEDIRKLKKIFGERELYKNYPFDQEIPVKVVFLKAFYIDRHEVTNEEYARFIKDTNYPAPMNWEFGKFPQGKGNFPVLYVSSTDAMKYASWAGKRLPTEDEWEKASRGTDGRVYPWGNSFDPYKSVTAESDLKFLAGALCELGTANKVELAPGDVSPFGVHDMAGNVREWTATTDSADEDNAVVKGGAWVDLSINARSAHREVLPLWSVSHIVGFRCVKDVE